MASSEGLDAIQVRLYLLEFPVLGLCGRFVNGTMNFLIIDGIVLL